MFRVSCFIYFLVVASAAITRKSLPVHMQGKIIGGVNTDISNYPYQASFEYLDSHFCGAAILTSYWVITAAHCVDQTDVNFVTIRVGTTTLSTEGSVHKAAETRDHPNFDYYTLDYDLSLIRVTEPFVYSTVIQPIELATAVPSPGTMAVTTGWGSEYSGGPYTKILQQVSIPIVRHEECNTSYEQFGGIGDTMICAGDESGKKDTCQGDSGGPLAVEGKLVGVASWGAGCGVRGFPGIYTNVALLRDFVVCVIGLELEQPGVYVDEC